MADQKSEESLLLLVALLQLPPPARIVHRLRLCFLPVKCGFVLVTLERTFGPAPTPALGSPFRR